jgi:hypothetical protein
MGFAPSKTQFHTYIMTMNRRQFSFGLGALAAAPSAPLAAILPQSGAVSSVALGHFNLAKVIAKSHNRCSSEMLMRHLKVGPEIAAEVQSLLLKKGVISQPSLAGISNAIDPTNLNFVPKPVAYKPEIVAKAADLRKKLQATMERNPDEVEIGQLTREESDEQA